MLIACSKDDGAEVASVYSVRYTVFTNGQNAVTINYAGADGKIVTVQQPGNFMEHQYSVGPVQAGFEASLEAKYTETEDTPVAMLAIEVSENGGKYVLKKSVNDSNLLKYTIE
ncbi:MAG: hypothetical protein K2J74_01685 [Muribaculaceae bacterium]|nr:hypothetical protein [Muribaculaceae bacterium]